MQIFGRCPARAISVAVWVSRKDNIPGMSTTRTTILGFLTLTAFAARIAADRGNLVVDNYGKLFLISTDGRQRILGDSMTLGALSPDGQNLAFTRDENPQASRIHRRSFPSCQLEEEPRNRSPNCRAARTSDRSAGGRMEAQS